MLNVARFINKHMIKILVIVIIIGIINGYFFPAWGPTLQPLLPYCLFIMLCPMMIGIKIEEVANTARRWKLLSLSLLFNYVFSPLLGAFLASLFLSAHPEFAVGMILMAVVPCAGMVVTWTGLSKGNMSLALVITALSLLSGIILIPVWVSVLAGKYVAVNAWGMLKTILIVILIPLLLGNFTRKQLQKKLGDDGFERLKPVFPAISSLGMYSVFTITMTTEGRHLIENPGYLAIIAGPLVVFYLLVFSSSVLSAKITGMEYPDMIALTFSVSGKNISITLALALLFFGPLTVMIIAIMPLVQVMFMAGFYRLSFLLRKVWGFKEEGALVNGK